ncbi:hypothetical protein KP509_32G044800 [Ceratopteris richardii]|uniref:S1 motif domain-containing protein n=2 Tax=Ceratopteris richardii TaxID=49495 RepID=A0A8T2QUX6_CERRI|nr:hypothetical protein KP509_32G044800 [Ceratopteris richardii]
MVGALAQGAAAAALKEPLGLSPAPSLGFSCSGLSGHRLSRAAHNGFRVHCAMAVVPKKKDSLISVAEEHWLRAIETPLEGVSFSIDDFSQALSNYDVNFEVGQMVKGTVFMSTNNGALVDIGAKAPAFLPISEASILRIKSVEEVGLIPGLEDDFYVLRSDDDNGRMVLSLKKTQLDLAWERCKQLQAEDAIVKTLVLAANRGGLVVDVEGLRGFVPFSHISSKTSYDDLIGKIIPVKFMEVDEEQARLVLSNKKALVENQISLGIGSVVEGVVQTVKPYGAFIDMKGVYGLLHISQISHERITSVENVFQPGDKLKVMILSQDKERGRISLSTKKLEPTPGDMLRNPSLVYEMAEEMAQTFRQRIAQAEAAARAEELRLNQEGEGLQSDSSGLGSLGLALEELDISSVPSAVEA